MSGAPVGRLWGTGARIERHMKQSGFRSSLSARLLLLTVIFVMIAEVLIYVPSIARYRLVWLEARLAAAHLAALTLEATPSGAIGPELERRLLGYTNSHSIEVSVGKTYTRMLGHVEPPEPEARFDLRSSGTVDLIYQAFGTLLRGADRVIEVRGPSPNEPSVEVAVIMNEAPLRREMVDYSARILQLSLVISFITAVLVYFSLRWFLVRPMSRLTRAMVAFRERPDDAGRIIRPSGRRDEIGVAEVELSAMQEGLRAALHHRARLAALGEAVTKINHDLRNILATAQLLSDRLAASGDPEVRRVTPALFAAIDRAVGLATRVVEFAKTGVPSIRRQPIAVGELVADAGSALVADGAGAVWVNAVPAGLSVTGDREQLLRVLLNLGRNALDGGAQRIEVSAQARPGWMSLTVADDGRGIPWAARETLFQPFSASSRADGSGLGLAIARELMHAHGGEIQLVETGETGTVFRLDLPARARG